LAVESIAKKESSLSDDMLELTALFANQGLTAPELDFRIPGRVRAGTTCRQQILLAIERLDGGGPAQWHSRDEIIAEVQRVNRRYPSETIRRVLSYDLIGGATVNHVATCEVERQDGCFRRVVAMGDRARRSCGKFYGPAVALTYNEVRLP